MPSRPAEDLFCRSRTSSPDGLIALEPNQIVSQFSHCCVAMIGLLGHRFQDNGLEIQRDGWIPPAQWNWIRMRNLPEQLLPIRGVKRRQACKEFVECCPQCIDICAMVDRP